MALFLPFGATLLLLQAALGLFQLWSDRIDAIREGTRRIINFMVSLLSVKVCGAYGGHGHAGGGERRLIDKIVLANVGVTADFGHSFFEVRHASRLDLVAAIDPIAPIVMQLMWLFLSGLLSEELAYFVIEHFITFNYLYSLV